MQDTNWTFTVDENGQTVVTEVKESSNALVDIIKTLRARKKARVAGVQNKTDEKEVDHSNHS